MSVPESYHQALLKLARDVDSALAYAGVTYWIDGGTLLGAVRGGGRIPHDDDVDFAILEREVFQTAVACYRLRDQGYSLEVTDDQINPAKSNWQ